MACVSTQQVPLCRNKDYFTPRTEDAENGTVVQRYLKKESGQRPEWYKNKRQPNVNQKKREKFKKKGSLEGRNKRRERKEEIMYHEKSKKERETRRKCIEI